MRSACRTLPIAALCCAALAATAGESRGEQASQQYLDQKAELEQMLERRNLELYEISFEPLALERIVLQDRLGQAVAYHYLTFRLRNQTGDRLSQPWSQFTGYNEVLASIAQQYESAKVVQENGTRLAVEGEGGVIVSRDDAQTRPRQAALTVVAFDENGTRLRQLDEQPGKGPQESFSFADDGERSVARPSSFVREKVEEAVQRRLLLPDEIRSRTLPPFDPTKRTEEGWAEGEVYGVVLFDDLTDHGDRFTIEVRGISNRYRIHWPPGQPGKVEDYLNAEFLRRTYVLEYSRIGDEHHRDQDPFVLQGQRWAWRPAFERLEQRRAMAYARFYLDNIANAADGGINAAVEREFWAYFGDRRGEHRDLPDLQAELDNREVPK